MAKTYRAPDGRVVYLSGHPHTSRHARRRFRKAQRSMLSRKGRRHLRKAKAREARQIRNAGRVKV